MMQTATGLTSSGLRDWVVQRISAVILAAYFIFFLFYFPCHPHLTYPDWQALFAHPVMRIFTFLALLALVAHAWVGMWTIFTDYIKATGLRLILQVLMVLALLGYLAWGIGLLWHFNLT